MVFGLILVKLRALDLTPNHQTKTSHTCRLPGRLFRLPGLSFRPPGRPAVSAGLISPVFSYFGTIKPPEVPENSETPLLSYPRHV